MAKDFTKLLVPAAAGAAFGGVQRMLWEKSERDGWIATGALLVGGIALHSFGPKDAMIQDISMAAAVAGATTAGWVMAEKQLLKPKAADVGTWRTAFGKDANAMPRVGHLPGASVARAHVLDGGVSEYTEI